MELEAKLVNLVQIKAKLSKGIYRVQDVERPTHPQQDGVEGVIEVAAWRSRVGSRVWYLYSTLLPQGGFVAGLVQAGLAGGSWAWLYWLGLMLSAAHFRSTPPHFLVHIWDV
jgi:hypothetical protein